MAESEDEFFSKPFSDPFNKGTFYDSLRQQKGTPKPESNQLQSLAVKNLQLSLENKLLLQRIYAAQLGIGVEELQGEFDEITKAAYDQARELLGLKSN